jgi:pimeloyl-ACP methyl ester carboxylesterase
MPLYGEPGERIAYERYPHPGGGPPLYLIHGFTASAASFAGNLAGLRKHFTVVTVELLGHGRSDAPPEPERYRPERAVARILGLMDELGDEQAIICGHSLGGAVALRCALAAPERFAGLVIINSASAAGTPAWAERAREGMLELARRVRAEGTGFLKQTRLYPAHSRRLDPGSRELLIRDFDRLTPAGLAGTAEGLIPFVNAFEQLPGLRVPTLVVVGQRDRDVMEVMPAFLAQVPHGLVRVVGLPEAGHAANLEAPAAFEEAVVTFARELGVLAPEPDAGRRPGGASTTLGVIGGVLVAAGLGLLFAALVVANLDRGDGEPSIAAAPESTATAGFTPVTAVAGTRTAVAIQGGGALTPVATPSPAGSPAGATATVPASTPTPPTPVPTRQPAAAGAATPTPTPTAVPTDTPTPTATPTPAGAWVAISGPVRVAVGESATFYAVSSPDPQPLRVTWVTPAGTTRDVYGVTVPFASEGCFEITLEAIFPDGKRTAVLNVAVGEATCGG